MTGVDITIHQMYMYIPVNIHDAFKTNVGAALFGAVNSRILMYNNTILLNVSAVGSVHPGPPTIQLSLLELGPWKLVLVDAV
jgi:hypothetical protein